MKAKIKIQVKTWWLPLVIMPLIISCASLVFARQMFPIHLNSGIGYGQDPAYQYLFSGVDILLGNAPMHTDHPGTPLQSIIAASILAVWLLMKTFRFSDAGLFDSVLIYPEYYLATVTGLMVLCTSLAVLYLGSRVYQSTSRYSYAVACQTTPLLFASVVPNLVFPSPEALLFGISIGLAGIIAPLLLSQPFERRIESEKSLIWVGAFCGIGLATKLTFLPMIGLVLLLRSPRLILRACFWTLLSWLIGVMPILKRLPTMFAWFHNLLTHSGMHGAGQEQAVTLEQLKGPMLGLIASFEYFYIVLFLLLVSMLLASGMIFYNKFTNLMKRRDTTTDDKLLFQTQNWYDAVVLFLVMTAQTIMVSKHPGANYMIPVLALAPLGMTWLLATQTIIPIRGIYNRVAIFACLSLFGYSAATSTLGSLETMAAIKSQARDSVAKIDAEIKKYNRPLLIGTFNCNFPECALWFGMMMVPDMEKRMLPIAPDFYHYDIFNRRLHEPGVGVLEPEEAELEINRAVASGRVVLMISPPFDQLSSFNLELILKTPNQNLYRVTGITRG
jgi:hypothetical protein